MSKETINSKIPAHLDQVTLDILGDLSWTEAINANAHALYITIQQSNLPQEIKVEALLKWKTHQALIKIIE